MQTQKQKLIGLFFLFELVTIVISLSFGHGRVQEVLAWISGIQLAIILFILLGVWTVKRKEKFFKNSTTLSQGGNIRIIVATLAIICIITGWVIAGFPALVRLSLQHYGVDDVATIQNYELVHQGSRMSEFDAESVSKADAINVQFRYNNRTSTISLQKDDPAFNEVYSAATKTNDDVLVRYLRWIPAIVLPKVDL
jgi:hypothetical protein